MHYHRLSVRLHGATLAGSFAALTGVLFLVLTGCYATGTKVDQTRLVEFTKGTTTCDQVEVALGKANMTLIRDDGSKQLQYSYLQSQLKAESFIPFWGRGVDIEQTETIFECTQDGLLATWTSSQGQTKSGQGFGGGAKQK